MNIIKKILGVFVVTAVFFGGVSVSIAAVSTSGGSFAVNSGTTGGGTSGGSTAGSGTSGGSTGPLVSEQLQNPIKYDTFSDFVAAVLETAVEILMPFVVLAFIWSGFLFVRAQGNEKELEEAKKAIYWSVIGAFILMGAWGFAQIISTTISTLTQ